MRSIAEIRRTMRSSTSRRGMQGAISALVVVLAVAGCQAAESLAGPTWHWAAQGETKAAGEPIDADPANYVIEFLLDGRVIVTADCNTVTGTYSVGVPLDLTIVLGTPALVDCGDPSVTGTYLESLGRVRSYSTDSGVLRLYFGEDEDEGMRFDRS